MGQGGLAVGCHRDVSAYCGKHMAKDFSEMVFSRDLEAPVVERALLWS